MKKMTPLMLATMMLAPSVLIDQAQAQNRQNERRVRPGNGDQAIGSRGNLLPERQFGNWDRGYFGRRSFKLIDDPEYNRVSASATQLIKELKGADATLTVREKALTDAKSAKKKIDDEVSKIEKAIVAALTTKTKKEAQLPALNQAVTEATNQKNLAQTAFTATETQLSNATTLLTETTTKLEAAKQECVQTPSDKCTKKVNRLTKKVANQTAKKEQAQTLHNTAKSNLDKKVTNLEKKEKTLGDTKKLIAKIARENGERAVKLEAKKTEVAGAKAKVTKAKNQLKPARKSYNEKLQARNQAVAQKNKLKNVLITEIMKLNRRGAIVGEEAGSIDGDYYAEYLGVSEGSQDGDLDGTRAGTTAGQTSAYNRGLGQGEIEGRQQADLDGDRDGTKLGTKQANVAAATSQATTDGTDQANNSDASEVGSNQGTVAGQDRAEREGKVAGEALGKQQAISLHETKTLNNDQATGNFAGAFAANVPSYPGFDCITIGSRRYYRDDYGWRGNRRQTIDHQTCPNFRPRKHSEFARTNRPILKEAFMDGYLRGYRVNRRAQFVESIDDYYLETYDDSRSAAYSEFSSRDYPSHREDGRQTGHSAAYDIRYPIVKEEARSDAFDRTINNPDTSSTDYTNTYASVRTSTYNRVYEQIRSSNFNRVEGETFVANIEEQTEIFRKARYAVVDAIYKNNPVVKFVESSIYDGGIDGVAKNDGVYQPGETTLHNVTIVNYGDKPATAVTVTNESGEKVKLPAIGAKSKVTVKGAIKGNVPTNAKIGSRHESVLKVHSPLTAEASIQGRHYYATSTGRVNFADKKTKAVQYPLSLSSLKTKSQLLINQANSLSIAATNNSNRKYTGGLKVEMRVNSQTGIITQNFSDISELSGTKTLSNAKVLVASEKDVYTPLTFSAKITKQGVTLGVLNSAFNTMAKAPYSKKSGKPVFVADSNKNSGDLVNALAQLGGLANASVIDLSLSRLNRDVLAKGLNKQVMIVLDDLNGSTVKGVSALLKNAEDTVTIFVDHRNQGLSIASRSNVLKNASIIPVRLKGNGEKFNLRFTNPYLDGVNEMTPVAQTTPRGMVAAMNTLKGLMKTNNELVAEAGSALSKSNIKSQNAKLQNMITMATAEIVNINKAYKVTDKDSYKKLSRDGRLIYAKILDASGKKVSKKTLGKNLAAMVMYKVVDHALDKFDPVDDVMSQDIEQQVEDRLRDTIKGTGLFRLGRGLRENLSRHDKSLYNSINDNPHVHSPFRI